MSNIAGTPSDIATRMYSDLIEMELQQKGSILEGTVAKEPGTMGDRRHIRRIGASDDTEELVTQFEPIDLKSSTFEDRYVTPQTIFDDKALSKLDLLRSSTDPKSQVVQSLVFSMGRQKDRVILGALGGTTLRNVAGSASNVSFNSGQTIAVNDSHYMPGSASPNYITGNVMLTEGKCQYAVQLLQQQYVDMDRDDVFCIASSKQLAFLRYRLALLGNARGDFMGKKPIMIPQLDPALDGYLGLRFIKYEELAATNQLTSSNEYVYFYTRDAIRLCQWDPLTTYVYEAYQQYKDRPWVVRCDETIGALRMDEMKTARAICTTS